MGLRSLSAIAGLLGACVGAFIGAATASVAVSPQPASAAAGPPERIDGVALADWTGRWWQWAFSFPDGLEPYRDRDGRLCDVGQRGPVWFLAGTDGSFDARRACRVPQGRHLLVPVINMVHYGPVSGPRARSCAALQKAAATNNDHLRSAVAVLDGESLPASAVLRLRTMRCFDPFPDADPATGADAKGESEGEGGFGLHAAADGYWLVLPPLSPGRHMLSIGANYAAPGDNGHGSMVQNFEYTLDVGEPTI
jgi:hypothetical protein